MKNDFKIVVCEVNFTSAEFTVQRIQIEQISDLRSLYGKTENLEGLISSINPDIIHFQEIPESFIPYSILQKIFRDNRKYNILVTTHSSQTRPEKITFMPDQFILVNKWSKQQFEKHYPKMCKVWEYPINRNKIMRSKEGVVFKNGYYHVLNVGLFTPGKNQGEIFDVARKLLDRKVHFHFVGNTAGNFEYYWKPLLDRKPKNCFIHGEQFNVTQYYQAADLMYFSSTFELNPIVVKEAVGLNLPVVMRKLPTYLNDYDKCDLVTYIKNGEEARQYILNQLKS